MIFHCECCDYHTSIQTNFNKHEMTAKHKKLTFCEKVSEKYHLKFHCEICDFHTSNRTDYTKHKMTAKHKKLTFCEKVSHPQNKIIIEPVTTLTGNCSSLLNSYGDPNLILNLLQQNNELQKQIIELSKEPKIVNNNNYTTNSGNTNTNNIQLNIHQFLNETCKNAPNFSDFIDNIQVTDNDLENNVKMGFVDGITKIIMDNLKQLALTDRPIHCTDVKRETIYVKEEDQWEKEKSKEVLQKGFQEITRKNICQLTEWREDNPEYEDMETELGEKSIVMQQNSMAGGKRDEFYPKIIKNIAKETILDKKRLLE